MQDAEPHRRSIGDASLWKRVSQKGIQWCQGELDGEHASGFGGKVRRSANACARHEDGGC